EASQRFLLAHLRRGDGTARFTGRRPGGGPVARTLALLGRAGDDLAEIVAEQVRLDALELARNVEQSIAQRRRLQHADQQVPRPYLGLSEHQRPVYPPALDGVLDVSGEIR